VNRHHMTFLLCVLGKHNNCIRNQMCKMKIADCMAMYGDEKVVKASRPVSLCLDLFVLMILVCVFFILHMCCITVTW